MKDKSIKVMRKYIIEMILDILGIILKQEGKAEKKICRPKMKAKKRLKLLRKLKHLNTTFTNLHALKEFVKTTDDHEILSYLEKLDHIDMERVGFGLAGSLLKSHEALSASVIAILHNNDFFLGDTEAPKDTLSLNQLTKEQEEEEEEDVERNPFYEEATIITAGGIPLEDEHGNSIIVPDEMGIPEEEREEDNA